MGHKRREVRAASAAEQPRPCWGPPGVASSCPRRGRKQGLASALPFSRAFDQPPAGLHLDVQAPLHAAHFHVLVEVTVHVALGGGQLQLQEGRGDGQSRVVRKAPGRLSFPLPCTRLGHARSTRLNSATLHMRSSGRWAWASLRICGQGRVLGTAQTGWGEQNQADLFPGWHQASPRPAWGSALPETTPFYSQVPNLPPRPPAVTYSSFPKHVVQPQPLLAASGGRGLFFFSNEPQVPGLPGAAPWLPRGHYSL